MPLFNLKSLFSSSEKTDAPPPIIGLDVVGRGIRFTPYQPYELKEVLFKRTHLNHIFHAVEEGKIYSVPDGYEVDEISPMSANQALSQIIIDESWDSFKKRFNIDPHITASHQVVNVEVKTGELKQLRSDEEAYYAARHFFMAFWTLSLSDVTRFSDKNVFALKIPTPYQYKNRKEYEKFFERYGTHYIKRAWIGGKLVLAFSVAKSTQLTKQDIRKGLNTCYTTQKESLEQLQKDSECLILGQGGDPTKLAALSSLDEAPYNEWLATIKEMPKVVEFEAVGIWTLLSDNNKAKALLDAYKAATTFTPLSAIINYDDRVYFLRGHECICYNTETRKTGEPKLITDMWPSLLEIKGFEMVEAVLKGTYIKSCEGIYLRHQLFLFKGNQCVRLNIESKQIDEGYPKPIAKQWPGVTFERIDATLSTDSESLYFFMGEQYIRYNLIENQVDPGYPKPIKERWAGITFDRIDAIMIWKDGMADFFKGDEYIRYNTVKYCAEEGYPKMLVGNYIEDWNLFD